MKINPDIIEYVVIPRPRKNGEGLKDSLYNQLNSLFGAVKIFAKQMEVDSVLTNGPGLCLSVYGAYYILCVLKAANLRPYFFRNYPRCFILRVSAERILCQPVGRSYIL